MPESSEIALLLLGGLVLLLAGGELLLRGGCRLASALGMPPVLIALTVLAFGSSAPELFVCMSAAHGAQSAPDQAELVLGNVLGSNLANLALVIGIAASMRIIPVDRRLLRVEIPLLVGLQLLLFPLLMNGVLGHLEGGLLFAAGMLYLGMIVRSGRRFRANAALDLPEEVREGKPGSTWAAVGLTLGGLLLLPLGADLLVDGGTRMAVQLGLSARFIGLTATAIGTSLPEVATTLLAIRRGDFAMAAGTVFGSNVFNLCYALGLSAAIFPLHLREDGAGPRMVDLGATLAITAGLSFVCLRHGRLGRITGGVLLCSYALVLVYGWWTGRVPEVSP